MNKKVIISALLSISIILSGCSKQNPKLENHEIINGISLGMTKEEVFEVYGDSYIYSEETYKNTVEYGYSLEKIDMFDVDIQTQVFFEFDKEKLICYGYHIGRTGDYYDSSFPYSENELVEAYDKIYEKLTEWYGNSSGTEVVDGDGKIKENLWETEQGSLWFIVGVNMWAVTEPVNYEKGVNEIVLSCSVLE